MRQGAASLLLIPIALAVAGAAPRQNDAVAAAPRAALDVRYVANEGFLLEGDGKRVLVDGLFGPGVTGYPVPPPELRAELEGGAGAGAGIQIALASHHHPDHFDAGSVARFLRANPDAWFVSTPQAVGMLEREVGGEAGLVTRARAVLPAPGTVERLELHGIPIEVLNLHHGARLPPVENLGFVVALGPMRFLHFGDTEAKLEDFEPYFPTLREVDLALLPFWFLASAWRAEMVRDVIRPDAIVVAHLPLPTAPAERFARWHSYDNLVSLIGDAFPEARFPGPPGTSYRFVERRE